MIKLLLVLNFHANDIALNVTKCSYFLVITHSQRYDLIFMVVEVLLIVKNVSHIPHCLDSAVPRGAHNFLALFQVNKIIDGIIVHWIGFGFAAVNSVKKVNVIVP